jgi:hypothetical protein
LAKDNLFAAKNPVATVFADLQILSRQYLQRDSICNDTGQMNAHARKIEKKHGNRF